MAELALHRAAATRILITSASGGEGLEDLRALVRGRTCVFVGHSGVGKSTLLNVLDPDRLRPTREVRARDGRGRHATTASSLTVLDDGTRLVDTPGVRAFGLPEGSVDAILGAFPDIEALARSCRFRDCAHGSEPGCAVRAAVADGSLPAERHAAFLKLRGET